MPQLDELGFILAPTVRSRAYVQFFVEQDIKPQNAFLIPGEERGWDGPDTVEVTLPNRERPFLFRPGVPARTTAERAGWKLIELPDADINSAACVARLSLPDADILIYSGLSKALLKKQTLDTGVRFLHAHGGYLPHYRGSTGFYYSLLDKGKLGMTAIWINAGIDTGDIVARRWYDPIVGLAVDYVQDPVMRAQLLADVINERLQSGHYPVVQADGVHPLHFVIHPVLKNIALDTVRP